MGRLAFGAPFTLAMAAVEDNRILKSALRFLDVCDNCHMKLRCLLAAVLLGFALTACTATVRSGSVAPTPRTTSATSRTVFGIEVSGNHLVDEHSGAVVQLVGINQMAAGGCDGARRQSAMIYGPTDPSSLAALAAWHVDSVRLSVNEDCWLGINGVPAATSGAVYREALSSYVNLLTSHRYYVIFDLHLNAPGAVVSDSEEPMADEDHAPAH